MASRNTPHWEASKFSFNSQNQAVEWKLFYTRALDFLKALDINPDEEDQGKKGWHQMKMMFEGDDCQALQTLINNNTIMPEAQHTPALALNTIQSVIKEDVYFWHYHDKILSDLCEMKASIPSVPKLTPWLANANSPLKIQKILLKLCCCNMQLSTMRQGTGYACKIKGQ